MAKYFISSQSGNDSNNGTSISTPWRTAPGMAGQGARTYSHVPGDQFIFKGGETWTASCFGMTIANGGTQATPDYYGVDVTWFTGSSWARPIFDSGGSAHPRTQQVINQANWVTIDNIEFTNFYWNTSPYPVCILRAGNQDGVVIRNCLFHNWTHLNATNSSTPPFDDMRACIVGDTQYNSPTGMDHCLIDSCTFDGSLAGDSGELSYASPNVKNCIARNMVNGPLFGNTFGHTCEISGNDFGPFVQVFDGFTHGNIIEQLTSGPALVHHNKFHGFNFGGITVFLNASVSTPHQIYNNLVYSVVPVPFQFDTRSSGGAGGSANIFNNTVVYSGNMLNQVGPIHQTLIAKNNHIIGGAIGANDGQSNNLVQTLSAATAAGYVLSNLYQPTSGSSPTVDAGTSSVNPPVIDDIMGVSRPQGNGWDIGAYERFTGSVSPPVITSPLSASGTVNTAFSYSITASNSPVSYGASPLPTGLSINTSSGVISGTPTGSGATTVVISATNAGGTGTANLSLTIKTGTAAPTITSPLTASGTINVAFSYTITGSNTPTSYGASGLPAGLSVNTGTGVISGTPTSAATTNATITATNGTGTGSATLAITIRSAQQTFQTTVTNTGETYFINGIRTHDQNPMAGTLPNIRTVQATFDDSGGTVSNWSYPGGVAYSPTRQTNEFVAALPAWKAKGVLACTLNFQGGQPKPSVIPNNSGFNADGSMKGPYQTRMDQAIRGLDANGMVAIVGYFYFGQTSVFGGNETAIKAAVTNATNWIVTQGYTNVIIEIANEIDTASYPAIIQPGRINELVSIIRGIKPGLKVSCSFVGGTVPSPAMAVLFDYILVHGNNQTSNWVTNTINTVRGYNLSKPIVVNEDSATIANFDAAVAGHASWGFHPPYANDYVTGFQGPPTNWSNITETVKSSFFTEVANFQSQITPPPPPPNNPVIQVAPTSLDFGFVPVGSTPTDKTFTVSNTGTGTLTGSASVTSPVFSVVGTATYSLTSGQTAQITIRYRPTVKASDSTNAIFTGAGGLVRQVLGKAYPLLPALQFNPDDGLVLSPFVINSSTHTVSQSLEIDVPGNAGQVRAGFTAPTTGAYTISALVNAPNDASNSLYIGIDTIPTEPANVWDIVAFTTGYNPRVACWRGTGTFDNPQFNPNTWNLNAGQTYQLIICGREANVGLGQITINPPATAPTIPPPPAAPTTPVPANNATGIGVNSAIAWSETDTVSGYNIFLGTVNPPPQVASGGQNKFYNPPSQLQYNAQYFAKVNAFLNWSSQGQSGTVTSPDLAWSFTTAQFIPPPPPALIIGSLTAVPDHGNAPLTTQFTVVFNGGTAPYTYDWDFGDGSTHGTTINPSHVYTTAGTFTAMVTINDSGGQSAHATVSVSTTVTPPPPTLTVSINANPTSGRVGDTVIFTSTVTGGIAGTKTYAWDFGDSDTSAASNPAHTYNSVGNFTAKLTVTDSGSNSASATQIITIAVFPPQVAWSSPTDNSTSTAPATFSLGAVAIANGGATITGVSFYRGGSTLIHAATLVAGVWTYSWTGVTAGDYTLTAKATDSSAATSTSTPIMVHVLTAGTVQVPQLIYVTP